MVSQLKEFLKGYGFDVSLLREYDKIFVLVSGGIDSTILYEAIKNEFPEKTYPTNCFNPYENSKSLEIIKKDNKFIQIKPSKEFDYKQILIDAFKQLPKAFEAYKNKKYYKKLFGCCYYIKHKAFLNNKIFKENNSVVVSGIKWNDGKQRRVFLSQLAKGKPIIGTSKTINNYEFIKSGIMDLDRQIPTFFLKHRTGQLYCYPYRDFRLKEIPKEIIDYMRKKYPDLNHSGCTLCPVLVLNNIQSEGHRYINSVKFARKLGLGKTIQEIEKWNKNKKYKK
ncbi:MAG: hypothetical protein ACTSPQ_22055 [Candidatus Helarchaeota archaeon]